MMLSMPKKIAYGMGRFGSSFLLTLTALTSFYIYGEYFTLNWLLAGIALASSYVVIGLTSWLVGYLSDSRETRWGRRKPFVIVGAPGLAITGFLLFVPNWFLLTTSPSQQAALFFYYLIVLCSFKFFYAFLTTPFQSWLPEITDEDERPLVSSMQNTANWVANGLGVVLGFITPLLFVTSPAPAVSQLGLLVVVIFAVITILFYLPSIIWVREKPNIVIPKKSLVEETAIVLRNRTYVGWMIAVGFLSFSLAAVNAQVVGFAQKVLLLNTLPLLLPPAISLLIATIVFLYVWIKLIRRVGKGRSTTIAMAFLAILLATTPFLNLLSPTIPAMYVAIIFFIPVAACIAVYYLMSYVVPADIAQVDEIETGQSRSGIYTGFIGVPLNFFQAASALLLGWLMDYSMANYGSNVWGLMWWGPLFAPFLIVAAIILHYVNIDPDFKALWAKKTGA
jgi:GPH family glycoside/pentoside/hexuronide:cation symporter